MNELDKKILKVIGLLVLGTTVCLVTWYNLPVTLNRYVDINFSDKIIEKIEEYKKSNGLPKTDDWTTLKQFGFRDKIEFLEPTYRKIDDDTFELIFFEGFDGPYLLWNSKERKWKKDMPTIPDDWKK